MRTTVKLSKYLKRWLKEHHFGNIKVRYGKSFDYNFETNTITYSLNLNDYNGYDEYYNQNGLMFSFDNFILMFFRLIGIKETAEEVHGDQEYKAALWVVTYLNSYPTSVGVLQEEINKMISEISDADSDNK